MRVEASSHGRNMQACSCGCLAKQLLLYICVFLYYDVVWNSMVCYVGHHIGFVLVYCV